MDFSESPLDLEDVKKLTKESRYRLDYQEYLKIRDSIVHNASNGNNQTQRFWFDMNTPQSVKTTILDYIKNRGFQVIENSDYSFVFRW